MCQNRKWKSPDLSHLSFLLQQATCWVGMWCGSFTDTTRWWPSQDQTRVKSSRGEKFKLDHTGVLGGHTVVVVKQLCSIRQVSWPVSYLPQLPPCFTKMPLPWMTLDSPGGQNGHCVIFVHSVAAWCQHRGGRPREKKMAHWAQSGSKQWARPIHIRQVPRDVCSSWAQTHTHIGSIFRAEHGECEGRD